MCRRVGSHSQHKHAHQPPIAGKLFDLYMHVQLLRQDYTCVYMYQYTKTAAVKLQQLAPNNTPLQGSDNKRATHIFWRGPWWKPRILTFEIAPPHRFWENRDVILHVKPMGKILCCGTITEFKLKIYGCCESSSCCYLNDYQWRLTYTLAIWRQLRVTSHCHNRIKRFRVCLEASYPLLNK